MIKKIFLSLLLVISFLFLSGFTTLAESETIAQVQEFPNATIKAEYNTVIEFLENANTYEYRVVYTISDEYSITRLDENEYFMITFHYITWRKGINRSTNSYELIDVHPAIGGGDTRINIRVTLLKSFVNDNYPDDISTFFINNSALYVIYTPIDYEDAYNDGFNDGYDEGYYDGRNDGYNDGYDEGYNDGYNYGHQSGYEDGRRDGYYGGRDIGYNEGYNTGRNDGYNDGYNKGYNAGRNDGYNEGYDDGYEDGYNDLNVSDYFGDRNIARAPDIDYAGVSDAWEPSTSIILVNKGYADPNILLDKPYLFVFIKKNIYDDVVVRFDDFSTVDQRDATYHEMSDYDIYVFNFTNRINRKYRLEIRKKNVTTVEEARKHLKDVEENLYFSHASKLLDSDMALSFYEMGYLTGLEKQLSNHEAYEAGYEKGYDDGYYDGKDDGYYLGYEDGFDDGKTAEYDKGYKDGYRQGSYDTFLNDVSKWFGPMVLIVLIAGAYVSLRNRRRDD